MFTRNLAGPFTLLTLMVATAIFAAPRRHAGDLQKSPACQEYYLTYFGGSEFTDLTRGTGFLKNTWYGNKFESVTASYISDGNQLVLTAGQRVAGDKATEAVIAFMTRDPTKPMDPVNYVYRLPFGTDCIAHLSDSTPGRSAKSQANAPHTAYQVKSYRSDPTQD